MASEQSAQTPEEKREELYKLRRLQMVLSMTLSVLRQDTELTLEEAKGLAARCKSVALAMFPGKESVFDLIYAPRLAREIRERFPRGEGNRRNREPLPRIGTDKRGLGAKIKAKSLKRRGTEETEDKRG
jgi:hypothetical protein